jgi:type I restriction enzyme S subunit
MSWEEFELGELCKIGRGSSPRPISNSKYFDEGDIPWVKIADATDSSRVIYKTKQHVNSYGASFSRLLPSGSLILSASGTVGFPMILGVEGCIHDGWLYFDDFKNITKEFLYYKLIDLNKYYYSLSYGGANIQNINTEIARKTKIKLPPLQTQKRIEDILSAYDDLIENNLKRIKLLEQAAQNIYKEWFVNLRFPEHESIPIIEETGLPEGWGNSELDSVSTVQSSKRVFLADYVGDGVPFFRGKEISQKVKHENVSEPYFISQEKFKEFDSKWGSPKENDILITAVGTIGNCYLVRKSDLPFYFKDGNLLWIHSYNHNISGLYLIQYFQSPIFKGVLNSISIGSSQKALTISAVKKLNITIPDIETLEKFNSIIMPIIKQIEVMTNMMIQLKSARDILLPRLMNRIIEV